MPERALMLVPQNSLAITGAPLRPGSLVTSHTQFWWMSPPMNTGLRGCRVRRLLISRWRACG